MEIAPLGSVQLPPGQAVRDVLCACFHPTLPSLYVGLRSSVVEYDTVEETAIGVFPVRMPPRHLLFLRSRNALVVSMEDGSVAVIDARDGHTLAEHTPAKGADASPFVATALYAPPEAGFSLLLSVRQASTVAQCINLFATNKKPAVFAGHKTCITALGVHPALPLVATSAADGTVRVFEVTTARLYNVIQAEKDGSGSSVKTFTGIHFHAGGHRAADAAGTTRTKGRRLRVGGGGGGGGGGGPEGVYAGIRLVLVSEQSLVVYHDVSIPGAPNKLRDFFQPGSHFRSSHFHTTEPDTVFTLDHKGTYAALHADPSLPAEAGGGGGSAASPSRDRKRRIKDVRSFTPNATAFSLLEECENVKPLALKVRPGGGGGGMHALMHPSTPHFVFYGPDLLGGKSRSLVIYHLQACAALGTWGRDPVALPIHSRLPTPLGYWHTPDFAHSEVAGTLHSLSLRGNNTIVVRTHAVQAADAGAASKELLRLVPRAVGGGGGGGKGGETLPHCTPLSLHTWGASAAVTVRCNGRDGGGAPRHTLLSLTSAGAAAAAADARFEPGRCCGFVAAGAAGAAECHALVLPEGGRRLVLRPVAPAGAAVRTLTATTLRVVHAVTVVAEEEGGAAAAAAAAPSLVLLQVAETQSGRCSLRLVEAEKLLGGGGGGDGTLETALLQGCGGVAEPLPLLPEEGLREATSLRLGRLGVATSQRVLLLLRCPGGGGLGGVAACEEKGGAHSVCWIGASLAFARGGGVYTVAAAGEVVRCASVPPRSSVVAALRDRLVLAHRGRGGIGGGGVVVWARHANHFEAVVRGVLAVSSDARATLAALTRLYDCRRAASAALLLKLLSRSGLADMAVQLAAQQQQQQRQQATGAAAASTSAGGLTDVCRLRVAAGDVSGAVAALIDGVKGGSGGGGGVGVAAADVVALAADLLAVVSAGSPEEAALISIGEGGSSKSTTAGGGGGGGGGSGGDDGAAGGRFHSALVTHFRRARSVDGLRKLSAALSGSSSPVFSRMAAAAADALQRAEPAGSAAAAAAAAAPPRPPPSGQEWTLGTCAAFPTTLTDPLQGDPLLRQRTLDPVPVRSLRAYCGGADEEAAAAAAAAARAGAAAGGGTPGADDSDDDDDDDGRLQEIGAAGVPELGDDDEFVVAPAAGAGGGEEDEVSKQQEELRRQYLASYAGADADAADDDDDDAFGQQKKFKKFEIKKEAMYKQSLANVTLGFAPVPSAVQKRQEAGGDADGGGGSGGGGDDAAAPSAAAAADVSSVPALFGTSAPEVCLTKKKPRTMYCIAPVCTPQCLRNGFAKLERNRYDDALKRFAGALVYLKSDATQLAKRTPLVQVSNDGNATQAQQASEQARRTRARALTHTHTHTHTHTGCTLHSCLQASEGGERTGRVWRRRQRCENRDPVRPPAAPSPAEEASARLPEEGPAQVHRQCKLRPGRGLHRGRRGRRGRVRRRLGGVRDERAVERRCQRRAADGGGAAVLLGCL